MIKHVTLVKIRRQQIPVVISSDWNDKNNPHRNKPKHLSGLRWPVPVGGGP
jgi:hypothetical protein